MPINTVAVCLVRVFRGKEANTNVTNENHIGRIKRICLFVPFVRFVSFVFQVSGKGSEEGDKQMERRKTENESPTPTPDHYSQVV